MATIKIDKNVPMPESKGKGITAVLRKLKVGESFVLPIENGASIRTLANRIGVRISVRTIDEETIRIWLVSK